MNYAILAVVIAVVILLIGGVVGFFLFAPGPRRWRAYNRATRFLSADQWEQALGAAEVMLPEVRGNPAWETRVKNLAGEARQRGAEHALKERDYETALEHSLAAADFLGLDPNEQRDSVVESMLAEVRRQFAAGPDKDDAVRALIARTKKVAGSVPPEASFWLGLCQAREGNLEDALVTMTAVSEQAGKNAIDPALYAGMLVHRLGRPNEALRFLADANRVDPNCPFVTWQMGVSLIASNGDSGLAMRALQKAIGPRGLALWEKQPERAWVEGFPETKSYVRRLAAKHRYVCPILGGDLTIVMRQGNLALAQAFYRQERFQEASELYGRLMGEGAPTLALMRGYGLSLARLGSYDQAYKHLRLALEEEDPKEPFTAGYLALCGALGKPTNPDDKPKNVAWALKLLARYPVMGNAEWAGLVLQVQSEARKVGVPLSVEDQLLLCDGLASVQAADVKAASAYSHLAQSFPDSLHPVHAWLYCRAATTHNVSGPRDADLFARTFREAGKAKGFYEQQKWDFADVEYTYLERFAKTSPGHFPEVLGPDYAPRGEAFLLERSRVQEEAGKKDPARTAVEVLLKLAPTSLAAHDRLACLCYRQGQVDRAVEILDGWRRLAPRDHWPLVRQAIIEQERGEAERRSEAIDNALGLTRGPLRAAVAFLGAKLALRQSMGGQLPPGKINARGEIDRTSTDNTPAPKQPLTGEGLDAPRRLLEECLREQPDHVDALWCLAAVRSVQGDRDGLAAQAPLMDRPTVTDPRFHFLGAVCQLAARNYRQAVELATRAAKDRSLETESRFVMAWAQLNLKEVDAALQSLRKVAGENKSPSAIYARALLGQLGLIRGSYDEAVQWWTNVEPASRARWELDEPLRQTVLLSGLLALKEGRFEQAAERFKEAGKLGLREKRLGSLITLALVKAGQKLLFEQSRK